MRDLKTFLLTSAAILGTLVWVAGCGQNASEETASGDQAASQGNIDRAKSDYEAALRKAQKEGQPADAQADLQKKIAAMQAAIDARRIQKEDQSRQAAAADLKAAKASADAHDFAGMMKSLSAAQDLQRASNDPQLNAEIDRLGRSQPVALMRTQAIYQQMCNEAGWSIGLRWLDVSGAWLVEFGSFTKDVSLKRAAAEVGDAELSKQASLVADSWTRYLEYKAAQRNTKDDNSTLGTAINLIATAGKWKNLMDYLQYQKSFEKRLAELMGTARMPDVQYAPVPRQVAAAPAAPSTGSGGQSAGGAAGSSAGGSSSGSNALPGGSTGAGGPATGASAGAANVTGPHGTVAASPVDSSLPGYGGVERH